MQLVYLEVLLLVKLKLPRPCKYRKFRNGAQLAFRSQYCGLVAISQNLTLLIFVMSRRPIHLIRILGFRVWCFHNHLATVPDNPPQDFRFIELTTLIPPP